MKIQVSQSVPALLAALMLSFGGSASAATSLLSQTDQNQLAAWLGQSQVQLTNIYTKAAGDTARDFHKAADGKGRTISVMQATNEKGQTWLIGGYNPQSWNSSGQFNITVPNELRTGFIFNLTSGVMFRQAPKTYALDTIGSYQTFNDARLGPTFGIGHDLYVPEDLTNGGFSLRYSYIDPVAGGFNTSLLDGSDYVRPNITYGAIEIYTIAAVPEPQTYLMLLAGMGMLAAARRCRQG
jgi:hypothetical protein